MQRPIPNLDKMTKEQIAPNATLITIEQGGFVRSFLLFLKKRRFLVLIGLLFLFGMLCGSILVRNSSEQTLRLLDTVLGGFIESRKAQSFFAVMASSFSSLFFFLAILFFCGFCSIAQPAAIATIFFKGLGYGFSIGMLYYEYGYRALGYVALLLTPTICLGAYVLIMAGRVSIKMSNLLFCTNILNKEIPSENRTKTYCIRYLLFLLIALAVAVIEAAIFTAFGGLFVL